MRDDIAKNKLSYGRLFYAIHLRIQTKTIKHDRKRAPIECLFYFLSLYCKAVRMRDSCNGNVWCKGLQIWPGTLFFHPRQLLGKCHFHKKNICLPSCTKGGNTRTLQ